MQFGLDHAAERSFRAAEELEPRFATPNHEYAIQGGLEMERRTFVGGVVTAPLTLCSGLSFFATEAAAQLFFPTLAGFGLGAMKQNGRPATGVRPLLLVLAQYSNHPAFNTFHPVEYYERLGFGNPTSPFSTANPVNPASLR
jgi:hypothetical protein